MGLAGGLRCKQELGLQVVFFFFNFDIFTYSQMSVCGCVYVIMGVRRGRRHRIWNWSYRRSVVNQLIRMLSVKLRSIRTELPLWPPGVIVLKQYSVVKKKNASCQLGFPRVSSYEATEDQAL